MVFFRLVSVMMAFLFIQLSAGTCRGAAMDTLIPESKPKQWDLIELEALEKMIKTLENKGSRKEMISQMQALIALRKSETTNQKAPFGVGKISDIIHQTSDKIIAFFSEVDALYRCLGQTCQDPILGGVILGILLNLGILIAIGYGVKILTSCLLNTLSQHKKKKGSLGFPPLVIDTVSLGAMVVAVIVSTMFYGAEGHQRAFITLGVGTILWYEILMAAAGACFSPKRPRFAFITLKESTIRIIYAYLRVVILTLVIGLGLAEFFFLIKAPIVLGAFILKTTLIITAYGTLTFIFRLKETVSGYLQGLSHGKSSFFGKKNEEKGKNPSSFLYGRIAQTWHLWASLYVLVFVGTIFFQTIYNLRSVALSFMGTAFLVSSAYVLFLRVPRFSARLIGDLQPSFPYLVFRGSFYRAVLSLTISLTIILILGYLTLDLWGVGLLDGFLDSDDNDVRAHALNLILLGFSGLMVWEIQEYILYRFFHKPQSVPKNTLKHKRLITLKPLFQNTSRTFVLAVFALIVFAELHLDVTPLLAGLGVVGIAFSFGSQSLVKDFITGVFMLAEDTMNVGDIVQIDGQKGTVETLSLRTVRFRDVEGNLHTIPYSAIDKVTNLTKSFAYFMVDVSLAYNQDIEHAITVMKETDEELRSNPLFAPFILEPLEVLGVDRFTRTGIIILARIKTVPDKNRWMVGRQFNKILARRFQGAGLEFFEQCLVIKGA